MYYFEDKIYPYTFTVFIPTWNRAHVLPRALDSIDKQTLRDLEVVIVDDGSMDGTAQLIAGWQKKTPFPVQYLYQANQGKHMAHNLALAHLNGFFTVILDSDDMLAQDALEILLRHWEGIPGDRKHDFAGVEGLCAMYGDGSIAGDTFPPPFIDSDYITIKNQFKISGDKKNAIRSDVLRRYPFPAFTGENYILPSLVWNRMAQDYKFRYINETIQYIEYQPDGLSATKKDIRWKNPRGFQLCVLEKLLIRQTKNTIRDYIRYVAYSLACGMGFATQFRQVPDKRLWLPALVGGIFKWMRHSVAMATPLRNGRSADQGLLSPTGRSTATYANMPGPVQVFNKSKKC